MRKKRAKIRPVPPVSFFYGERDGLLIFKISDHASYEDFISRVKQVWASHISRKVPKNAIDRIPSSKTALRLRAIHIDNQQILRSRVQKFSLTKRNYKLHKEILDISRDIAKKWEEDERPFTKKEAAPFVHDQLLSNGSTNVPSVGRIRVLMSTPLRKP